MPHPRPLEERFWEKVDKSGECWLWTAHVKRSGYGQFTRAHHVPIGAHQMSYILAHGPIPAGMLVCHRCDNPICVRPEHLFLGTNAQNLADMKAKGRSRRGPTRKPVLSDEHRAEIKALYHPGRVSMREIGERYGVTRFAVHHVLKDRKKVR